MTRYYILLLATFLLSSCGVFKSPLEKEYERLSEQTATTSADAERLYDEAEKFVVRVGQFKNPPKGMAAKALDLQRKRAVEFAKSSVQDWGAGVAAKVTKALRESGLKPADAGLGSDKIKPTVDPLADEIPQEKGWR